MPFRDTVSSAAAPTTRNVGKIKSAREKAASLIRCGRHGCDPAASSASAFPGAGSPSRWRRAFCDGAAGSANGVGEPRGLSLVYAAGQGDGEERGWMRLPAAVANWSASSADAGGWCRSCRPWPLSGSIEAYNLPQGVIAHLYRDITAGKPGGLTQIGLDTSPIQARRRQAQRPHDPRSSQPDADRYGEVSLLPAGFRSTSQSSASTTAITTATSRWGAVALTLEALSIAMAAHNSGGRVMVERIAERGSLNPRQVVIHVLGRLRGGCRAARGPHRRPSPSSTPQPLPARCACP